MILSKFTNQNFTRSEILRPNESYFVYGDTITPQQLGTHIMHMVILIIKRHLVDQTVFQVTTLLMNYRTTQRHQLKAVRNRIELDEREFSITDGIAKSLSPVHIGDPFIERQICRNKRLVTTAAA